MSCIHPLGQNLETCPECLVENEIRKQGGEIIATEITRDMMRAMQSMDNYVEQQKKKGDVNHCEVAAFNGFLEGLQHALAVCRGENPWQRQTEPRYGDIKK